jgi:hypothetical protein
MIGPPFGILSITFMTCIIRITHNTYIKYITHIYYITGTASLVSKPDVNVDDWSSFWHPLYGTCFTFKPQKSVVEDYLGEAGLEFVKVNLNFEAAFAGK